MQLIALTYRSIRALFTLTAALALAACAFPKVVGDSPLDTTGTTGAPGTTTEAIVTDGPPPGCANPAFTCSQPIDCEQWRCGALDSPFDAAGCLRPSCADAPCGASEVCYSVEQSNDCIIDVTACADVDGACSCELDDDCFGRFCVPADEGPPALCPTLTDKDACLAAGCSEFTTVTPATIVDGACVYGEAIPACLWFPGDVWGGNATPGSFYKQDTGEAVQFATDWLVPPHGWGDCGAPGAPPSCACFGLCAGLQQQAAELLEADKPCADVSDCVLASAECYDHNVCGSVGVHKDSASAWSDLHGDLQSFECCAGADPCGGSLACEDQRCVVVFP